MASKAGAEDVGAETGKRAGKIDYPLRVEYCGVCTLPPEVILCVSDTEINCE